MGALRDGVQMARTPVPPQEMTEGRREAARLAGVAIPPSAKEIEAYRAAGLEPPTE
ncbi:hypothetical protein GV792_04700 [Nocardia cyriacigeorgica]|uniref:hypothetical protein n=1 Tax=Nocardia cyriacigeorgica TaxID=135487 RepID=UPI0013B7858B|nr:hypothetical protein [Nocardia cyriacigeorgica]NEW49342.1 hypothetical protein [Nocardia cyriacigeorgica]